MAANMAFSTIAIAVLPHLDRGFCWQEASSGAYPLQRHARDPAKRDGEVDRRAKAGRGQDSQRGE